MDPQLCTAPERRLVAVYDGGCGFCTAMVAWAERRDRQKRIDFQDGRDAAVLERLGVDQDLAARTLVVLEPSTGKRFLRAAAIGRLLCAMGAWAALGWLLRAPLLRPILDGLYRAAANRRHRLSKFAGLRSCSLPDEERGSRRDGQSPGSDVR